MTTLHTWLLIGAAVLIALSANYISVMWAGKEDKFNLWLLLLVLIAPLVFITFGIVTAKIGVVVSSGTIDSLLTITTILLGLFIFGEWGTITKYQYAGMFFTVSGLILLHLKL